VVPGAKSGPDALTLLLRGLLARDEAVVEPIPVDGADKPALAAALTSPKIPHCDLVLLAGRSGAGLDDTAPLAVAAAGGVLALHGLALRPGGATGLGMLPVVHAIGPGTLPAERAMGLGSLSAEPAIGAGTLPAEHAIGCSDSCRHERDNGVPIILLPGDPFACLVAYDMLAARLVRRLAGTGTPLPYPVVEFELTRKVASGIGIMEIVPVTLAGSEAQAIGTDAGLVGAVQADGFVVVAAESEGYPAHARVRVHLYGTGRIGAAQAMLS
jgi:molybdopterin molybdotransferase